MNPLYSETRPIHPVQVIEGALMGAACVAGALVLVFWWVW